MSTPTQAKPPLTDEQKKMNHIASEQQRRQTIRAAFDELSEMVPGMKGEARSEAKVLQATVDYLKEQLELKTELKAKALAEGVSEEEFESYYQPSGDYQPSHEPDKGNNGTCEKVKDEANGGSPKSETDAKVK